MEHELDPARRDEVLGEAVRTSPVEPMWRTSGSPARPRRDDPAIRTPDRIDCCVGHNESVE